MLMNKIRIALLLALCGIGDHISDIDFADVVEKQHFDYAIDIDFFRGKARK